MKKKAIILISLLLLAGTFSACKNISKEAVSPIAIKNSSENFTVYDFGKIKLHAYNTNDPLSDEAYILESSTSLVGIELPSFTKNLELWKKYVASLNKPIQDIFIANHPTGASYVKNKNIYATKEAKNSIENGAISFITQGLSKNFGKDFHGESEVIEINKIINPGEFTIGDIKFNIIPNEYSYDIEIPAINSIYTHMLGKTTHSIINKTEEIDTLIKTLKNYQDKNYLFILSAHSTPERQDAVAEKIHYIKKIKEFSKKYHTKEEFIKNIKNEFPNYSGENYLEMTADALYK